MLLPGQGVGFSIGDSSLYQSHSVSLWNLCWREGKGCHVEKVEYDITSSLCPWGAELQAAIAQEASQKIEQSLVA